MLKRLGSLTTFFVILTACSKVPEVAAIQDELIPRATGVSLVSATLDECPQGGSVLKVFRDLNENMLLDVGEPILSSTPVCNGAQGVAGDQGYGAGILVSSAPELSCSAGGSVLKTFIDRNNNGLLEEIESVTSVTTICNGRDGANGTNGSNGSNGSNGADGAAARLSVTSASLAQCPAGGAVYSSSVGTQLVPDVYVVCNGVNGTNGRDGTNGTNGSNGSNGQNGADGRDARFFMGQVGPSLDANFSACRHDYLYFPDPSEGGRGWLTFRHQSNGAADEGIGSTGFQIWNVDIADFALVSEQKNVTYCQLHWDPRERVLSYEVIDNRDGLAGKRGEIRF